MSVLVPPEITDNIIALVDSGQTATFLACSLVCRDWLPASRRRLFETVHFSRHHLYDLFLTRILRSVTMRWWLSYVLNVKISDPWSPLGKEAPRLDERRTNRFIHEFAGRLPNLQELSFEDADWIIRPPHPSVSVVCRNFSSVRQLALFRCRFPSFGAFRSMLASFPHLEHLDIFAIAWPGAQLSPIPMAVHDGSPSLRTFRMSAGGPELCAIAITRWLALTRTARTVKDVHLGKFFASTYLAFLQAAAASLTTLGTPLLTDFVRCQPLHFVNLERLELSFDFNTHWGKLAVALDVLHGNRLRSLVLHDVQVLWPLAESESDARPRYRIADEGMEALDMVFEQEAYKTFSDLCLHVEVQREHAAVAEGQIMRYIRLKLPKFYVRGGDVRLQIERF